MSDVPNLPDAAATSAMASTEVVPLKYLPRSTMGTPLYVSM